MKQATLLNFHAPREPDEHATVTDHETAVDGTSGEAHTVYNGMGGLHVR